MGTTGFEVMDMLVKAKGASDYENCNSWLECGVRSYYITDDMFVDVWYDYSGYKFWGLYYNHHVIPECAYAVTSKGVFVEIESGDYYDIINALVDLLNEAENVDDLKVDCIGDELYQALDDWHNKLHEIYL